MIFAFIPWIHAVGIAVSLLLAAFIILLVLFQEEKGGGLAGAFGGSGTISTFGVETSQATARITWVLFTIWLVTSLVIAVNARDRMTSGSGATGTVLEAPTETPAEPARP